MNCKIYDCDREATYKQQQVCQMHYFRFMRTGCYEKRKRKYRIQNPAGYQKLFEPEHKLSNSDGYVYEHRFVYFNSGKDASRCSVCDKKINWKNLHIDHIDEDVTNNSIENLRPTCRNCNTTRNRKAEDLCGYFLEYNGDNMSIADWARREDVEVSYTTIKRRLQNGATAKEALYGKRKTHHNTQTKKSKLNYMI